MFNRLMIRLETLYQNSTMLRRANALAWSILGLAGGFLLTVLLVLGMRTYTGPLVSAMIAVASIIFILLGSYALLLRGQLTLAGRVLSFGLLAVTAASTFVLPVGMNTAAAAGLIMLTLALSALFLSRQESLILTFLFAGLILIWGLTQAFVPQGAGTWQPIQQGIFLIIATLIAGVILSYMLEQYIISAERAETQAMEMANLADALEQQSDRLAVINEISQLSGDMMPFESLGQMVTERLLPLLSPEHVSIGFLQTNKQNADFTTYYGPEMPDRLNITKTPFEYALQENRTIRLNYRDQQRGTRFLYQVKGVKFLLIVPLSARDQMYGTLNIGFAEPDSIIADDVQLCEQIGRQIAVMLENMQLYGKLDQEVDEQSALYNTSLAINAANDLPTIYQMALKELANISGGNRIDIYATGPDPHVIISHLTRAATWIDGQVSLFPAREPIPLEDHPALETIRTLQTNMVLVKEEIDDRLDLDFRRGFLESGVAQVMILPIKSGPVWLGFVLLQVFHEQHLTSMQIRLCRGIADQVALAVDSQVLLSQARNAAKREQVINKLSYQLDRANSVDDIIRVALKELRHTLGAESVAIRLGNPGDTAGRSGGGRNNG